ncbi:GLPGLI family protein [uncultured Chryseobacterium sp.]|uniref:GLPGLI family protein n=1 Tax=uncultured Chryseobacterium sp. TaxID=259322 RepID=UPI0025CDC72B|nr:GLPGLI family protein [uncultured Chryseobacterium sp.]
MNKIIAFGCIMLGIFAQAQINRFFYDYQYIPDSGNREDVKKEMMYLDISSKGSRYYSRDAFIADSVQMAKVAAMMKGVSLQSAGGGRAKAFVMGGNNNMNKVVKEYPSFTTYLLTSIGADRYKVKEDRKPDWKILPDKQKIGEYNAQKATATFGGRDWIAWFTTDIPFQDGPYKFYGLPGLIVKIEDTTGSHKMTLAGNKKVNASEGSDTDSSKTASLPILASLGSDGKEIELTNAQFRKAWKEYQADPAKNMKQMLSNVGSGKIMMNGGDVNQAEVIRHIEKTQKEAMAKNNNPIEPDLVK